MSKPMRAHAYTVDHTYAAGRFRDAVLMAAATWHDANRNATDAETALQSARDEDNDALAGMLEHAQLSAVTYLEHAYAQLVLLVKGYTHDETWEGEARGHRYSVRWSAFFQQVTVYPHKL
jgi:hypothetical protein